MKKNKKLLTWIIVIVIILGYVGMTYNSFVVKKENLTNQWAQVETQYQRRFDLIPNLVESVKGIMKQEQEIFNNLAEARTRYAGANSVSEKAESASQVESALGRLLVIMENYPQLNSSQNVQSLMSQIEGTENRISVERKRYNDSVKSFNTLAKRIPSKFVAMLFNFGEENYFESVEGSEIAPEVKF